MEDAKTDDVHFVCTWLRSERTGCSFLGRSEMSLDILPCKELLEHGRPQTLSSRERGNIYVFADPTHKDNLLVALETLAKPVGKQETLAEADARRQALKQGQRQTQKLRR